MGAQSGSGRRSFDDIPDEVVFAACEKWIRDKKEQKEIRNELNEEFPSIRALKLTPNDVHTLLSVGHKREFFVLCPAREDQLSRLLGANCRLGPHDRDRIHVVASKGTDVREQVATYAADLIERIIVSRVAKESVG